MFAPEIFTEYSLNPAACKVVATTARVSSAAFFSVAVTSTNKLLVLVETVVNAEFIIGGNEIVFPSESMIMGMLDEAPRIAPYC